MLSVAQRHHREQERPWSCVAACVRIIKAWRGEEVEEKSLLAAWSGFEMAIGNLKEVGKRDDRDPLDPLEVERLREELRHSWLVVILSAGPLTHFIQQQEPPPVSKHGRILPYEYVRDSHELRHAVVLVEAVEPETILYLDPYYPKHRQPFALTNDELVEAWTGIVFIPGQ